jgi:hypothetical protein
MSSVSQYLNDMDLISLCVSYPPLQPYFFSQLKNLAILTHPFCLIEYDIDRCRRLTHLLNMSSYENLTAFHKIPKTLRIRQHHLKWSRLPVYTDLEEGGKFSGGIGWPEMFSTIAMSCPNINQFIYEASPSARSHRTPPSVLAERKVCQCSDCNMVRILNFIPPMPNLKKLCLFTDTLPEIQSAIANIISQARIEEFKYVCSGHPYVHRQLISRIQSTDSLQSLIILSRSPAMTLTLLTVKLCTAFNTIHHLQMDDRSWQSPDRAHTLELIATLNLINLKSFRYEATLYRDLTDNMNLSINLPPPGLPAVVPRDLLSILPGYTPPGDIYELRRHPEYIGYLKSNKGIMLTKFFTSFPSLTRLELKNCSFLNDTFFLSIWECLPQLSELLIQDCPDMTGTSYIKPSYGKGWTQLTKLDISTCKNITDQCIYSIAEITKASRVQLLVYERPMARLNPIMNDILELGYRIGCTYKPSSMVLLRGFENDEESAE